MKKQMWSVLLALTMAVGLFLGMTVSVSAADTPPYKIAVYDRCDFNLTYGYTGDNYYNIRIQNKGTAPTGDLNITLTGANSEYFQVSKTSVSSIAAGVTVVTPIAIFNSI